MQEEMMILVDENDIPTGEMEKMRAHEKGVLHRAFSCFVFNDNGETLIQQRAYSKYHNPGIWANTCCSHPRPGESTINAAKRRMFEELGFDIEPKDIGWFVYKAEFSNGLIEYELDHVLVTKYNTQPIAPNPNEVANIRWISKNDLEKEISKKPENFSFWLRRIMELNILPWNMYLSHVK